MGVARRFGTRNCLIGGLSRGNQGRALCGLACVLGAHPGRALGGVNRAHGAVSWREKVAQCSRVLGAVTTAPMDRRFGVALGGALVAHLALMLMFGVVPRQAARPLAATTANDSSSLRLIDVEFHEGAAASFQAAPSEARRGLTAMPSPPPDVAEPLQLGQKNRPERSQGSPAGNDSAPTRGPSNQVSSKLASVAPPIESVLNGSMGAVIEKVEPAAVEPSGRAAATTEQPRAGAPRLTPEQLGIGENNPFFASLPDQSETALAEERLGRNMAQAMLDQDRETSLGVEGPVVRAVSDAAMGTAPPRSQARLLVVTNERGVVSHVEVLSTNLGFEEWEKVARRVLAVLAKSPLRTPKGRRVELVLDVESKVQLPSGRSPGMGVRVFGVPISEKEHDDSSQISILSPKFKIDSAKVPLGPPGQTLEIPSIQLGFSVLGIDADPTDILAPARQVVQTRLVRQRVL